MKGKLKYILLGVSFVWIIFAGFIFSQYMLANKEIQEVNKYKDEIGKLDLYKRNADVLEMQFMSMGDTSLSSKSLADFITKLPKVSEMTGIKKITIENSGTKKEDQREITEIKVSANSSFASIANFIDILERSRLPIQIVNLQMSYQGGSLSTTMIIRLSKKVTEE
jgi:hypothetical protein